MMKFITQANQKQKEEFESMNQKIDFVNQKIDRLYSSFYGASGASARLPPPPDSYMDDRPMKGYVKKDEFAAMNEKIDALNRLITDSASRSAPTSPRKSKPKKKPK